MILRVLRAVFVLAVSAVAVPYTVAIVSNILHGWPQCTNKYKRALNPRKVFGLNFVLFQMLRDKTRYIFLYISWKNFYRNADPRRLYKNLTFGRNDCTLDVYLPKDRELNANLPVVIFVYGGAWSSGDKSSYGLLCSNIVTQTQTVVVCPNYSIYPKGYVDDMIQDVVDSIGWVIDNIHEYGGDKDKLILLGHSAGAHLATMAILELLHDERLSMKPSFRFQPTGGQFEQLAFTESHYGKMSALSAGRDCLEDSSGSSESFAVVSENGSATEQNAAGLAEAAATTSSLFTAGMNMELIQSTLDSDGLGQQESGDHGRRGYRKPETEDKTDARGEIRGATSKDRSLEQRAEGDSGDARSRSHSHSGSLGDDEDEHDEDSGDNDSVVTVRPKDIERHATLVDMCKSIKAFIGLAGVYSISDHFQHESMRGIEDVSCMCRAHYGQDHFARFSPKEIIRSLGNCLSLPLMVLAHGVDDYVSPLSATLTFADALAGISANVKVKVIPGCDHYEICLDLMETQRKFHSHIMNIIMETISAVS